MSEAEQLVALRAGDADVALVRLPIDSDGLSVIPLYSEVAVAVAPKDHMIAAADELALADLDGEARVAGADGLPDVMVLELVAAGLGIALVPHSVARLHARRDVVARPVTDAPETRIALAWPTDATTSDVEEFIGVVRGRTANSSRGSGTTETDPAPAQAKADSATKATGSRKATGSTDKKPPFRAKKRHIPPSRSRRRRG